MPAFFFTASAILLWALAFFPFMERALRLVGVCGGCAYAIAIYWTCAALLLLGGIVAFSVAVICRQLWNHWYTAALLAGIPGLLFYIAAFMAQLSGH